MKRSNLLSHVRQLCGLGLPSESVMPALLKAVRRLVPCDSAGFFWVDERGDMSNMYAERMLSPALMRRYFEQYYAAPGQSFRARLLERAQQDRFVVASDADGSTEASRYYKEILQPLDAHRVLHAIVHDRRRPLGQLSLYRGRRAPSFSDQDAQNIATAARYFAACFDGKASVPAARDGVYHDSGEEALVVAGPDGEIATASHRAYAMLAHAAGEPINRSTMSGAVDHAARTLLKRVSAAVQGAAPVPEAPPAIGVTNAWGRFRLFGYALAPSEVGVVIRRDEHMLVRMVDGMSALPLSAQQRETALLLAQGRSNGEIAEAMGVTLNTASYHVKQLFQKLDAHNRNEVVARILAGTPAR